MPEKFSLQPENFKPEFSPEFENQEPTFDAVILLTSGFKDNKNPTFSSESGLPQLDLAGKIRALAAGEILSRGEVPKLIITGGRFWGEENPSLASETWKYIKAKYPEIPESSVILLEEAIDTNSNVNNSVRIMKENGIKNVLLLSSGFHLKRAKDYFSEAGIEVFDTRAAEQETAKRSSRHQKLIEKYQKSFGLKIEQAKEIVLSGIAKIDKKGNLIRDIATKLRAKK